MNQPILCWPVGTATVDDRSGNSGQLQRTGFGAGVLMTRLERINAPTDGRPTEFYQILNDQIKWPDNSLYIRTGTFNLLLLLLILYSSQSFQLGQQQKNLSTFHSFVGAFLQFTRGADS